MCLTFYAGRTFRCPFLASTGCVEGQTGRPAILPPARQVDALLRREPLSRQIALARRSPFIEPI
jgi:hypothetical protein